MGSASLSSGNIELVARARQLRIAGREIAVEPKLFDLLAFFMSQPDRMASKDDLLAVVWPKQVVTDAAISQAVAKLRKLLNDQGAVGVTLRTVHGRGYRWEVSAATSHGHRQRWWWTLGAALATVAIAALFMRSPQASLTLAVAPFAVAPDDLQWAELGLASMVGDSIQTRTGVRVLSPARVRASLRTLGVASDAPPQEQLEALRALLGADHLLQTEISRRDGGYHVSYQLASVEGAPRSGVFSEDALEGLSYDFTERLAADLDVAYQAGIPVKKISPDDFANEAFARGLQALLGGDSESAKSYFESALASDDELDWARYELANALQYLGQWEPAQQAFQRVMVRAQQGADVNLAGAAASGLGQLAWRRGDLAAAETHYRQAQRWFDQAGNQANLASAYGNLGILAENHQRWDQARQLYHRALTLYRNEGERFGESAVYSNLALIERKLGRHDSAFELQQKAIAIQRRAGLRQMLTYSLNHAAIIEAARGNLAAADGLHRDSIELAQAIKDPLNAAEARTAYAALLFDLGRLQDAIKLLDLALPVYQRLDNPAGEAVARLTLGRVLVALARPEQALAEFEQAQTLFQQVDNQPSVVVVLLARVALVPQQASALLGRALTLAQELGDDAILAQVEQQRAVMADDPLPHYQAALAHARNAGDRRREALVAIDYALWLLDRDRPDKIPSLLGLAEAWHPQYHAYLFARGRYLAAIKQQADALAVLNQAKSAAAEAWRPEQEAVLQAVVKSLSGSS